MRKISDLSNKYQKWLLAAIVVCLLTSGMLVYTTIMQNTIPIVNKDNTGLIKIPDSQELLSQAYYGVLVLGSDEGATLTNGGNHTDSVTYVAINIKTKKAYALPIYRDAFIENICTNEFININHIYRDNGAECLSKSVSNMLELPVDYYIYITSNGFVDFFNTIGTLAIEAEATYCSNFGNDAQEYCFTAGETNELNGNQLLAYTRFRGKTSGEARANRHVQVLNKAYDKCLNDTTLCATAIGKQLLTQDIQTNFPYGAAMQLSMATDITLLGVLQGTNFEDNTGWHQRININDLNEKTSKIKQDIFVA